MKNDKLHITLLFILSILIVGSFDSAAQCAMCKAAAESSLNQNPNSIAHGLNKGILFLMAIPYLAIGIIFRRELKGIINHIRGRSDEKFDTSNLGRFTFAFSFVSVMVILFIIFMYVH